MDRVIVELKEINFKLFAAWDISGCLWLRVGVKEARIWTLAPYVTRCFGR